jgi:hypothetical protein
MVVEWARASSCLHRLRGGALSRVLCVAGSDAAFSWPIIRWILEINGLAMVGLLALHRLAIMIDQVARRPIGAAAAAA